MLKKLRGKGWGAMTDPDYWMLPEGDYTIAIGLFKRGVENATVRRTESFVQVRSKAEARYYFNQFIDLSRRVRKLERAAGRLF